MVVSLRSRPDGIPVARGRAGGGADGTDGRDLSAAAASPLDPPTAAALALREARRAWARTEQQLELEVWPA